MPWIKVWRLLPLFVSALWAFIGWRWNARRWRQQLEAHDRARSVEQADKHHAQADQAARRARVARESTAAKLAEIKRLDPSAADLVDRLNRI